MRIDKRYRVPKIVAQHEQAPSWLRILLLLLIVLVTGWYGFQLGGADSQRGLVGIKPTAKETISELEDERDELRRQLTMAEQSAQMDREALHAVKEQIKLFQDERLKLEEELAFLRGIVSTGPDKKGLRIQKFKLEPALEAEAYKYAFSVTQVINSGKVAKGRILVSLEGLLDGRSKTLKLKELTDNKLESHKMRFRYFQNIEGKLKLPGGFQPAKLTIEVKPEGKKLEPVRESYSWDPVS